MIRKVSDVSNVIACLAILVQLCDLDGAEISQRAVAVLSGPGKVNGTLFFEQRINKLNGSGFDEGLIITGVLQGEFHCLFAFLLEQPSM